VIADIHLGYLRAGADANETNTFGGSPTLTEFELAGGCSRSTSAAPSWRARRSPARGHGRARFVIGAIGLAPVCPRSGIAYRTLEDAFACRRPA
jgi:5-methyltetrahydrofolate--homocysteine methyltransferase